jgi:hypothetical protein
VVAWAWDRVVGTVPGGAPGGDHRFGTQNRGRSGPQSRMAISGRPAPGDQHFGTRGRPIEPRLTAPAAGAQAAARRKGEPLRPAVQAAGSAAASAC